MGASRDNKTISPVQLGPIVPLFLLMLYPPSTSFPSVFWKALSSPTLHTHLATPSALLALFVSPHLRTLDPIYSRIRVVWNRLPFVLPTFAPFFPIASSLTFIRGAARDLFVKSTHPSKRRERKKLKPSPVLAYPSLWSLGITANLGFFPTWRVGLFIFVYGSHGSFSEAKSAYKHRSRVRARSDVPSTFGCAFVHDANLDWNPRAAPSSVNQNCLYRNRFPIRYCDRY